MEFKLIKKFLPELNIWRTSSDFNIRASDLEAELAKGVEVYGERKIDDAPNIATEYVERFDTHSGLLIGYKQIESSKPVSKSELIDLLQDLRSSMNVVGGEERLGTEISLTDKVLKRILEVGVKND